MKATAIILVLCGFSCVFSVPVENSNSNPLSYQQQRQRQRRSAIGSIGNYYTGALYTSGGGSDGKPGHGAIGSIDNYVVGSGGVTPLGSNSASGFGSGPGLVNYFSSTDHENPAATLVSDKYLYAGWRLIPNGFSAMDDAATALTYWKNKAQYLKTEASQNFPSAGIVNYYD